MKKTKNETLKEMLVKESKKLDWCELASDIIALEQCIKIDINAKQLKLLNQKLKIWEVEKQLRVVNAFDVGHFMSKELDVF